MLLYLLLHLCLLALQQTLAFETFNLDGTTIMSMEELLVARSSSDLKAFDSAKMLIRSLDSAPICVHAPTSRLLRQCKTAKFEGQHTDTAQHLEIAKSAYAISLAICETRDTKITPPWSCESFVDHLNLDHGPDLFTALDKDKIADCLGDLKSKHYFWTSYSNNRQNANDLCDSSRIDYQREELLDIYRQLSNTIPDLTEILQSHGQQISSLTDNLHASAEELMASQLTMTSQRHEQYLAFQEMLEDQFQHFRGNIDSFAASLTKTEKDWQVALTNATTTARNDVLELSLGTTTMQSNFNRFYASIQEMVSKMAFDYETSIESWQQQTGDIVQQVIKLGSSGNLENLREHIALSREAAEDFRASQAKQIESGRELTAILQVGTDHAKSLAEVIDRLPYKFLASLGELWAMRSALLCEIQLALAVLIVATLSWFVKGCAGAGIVLLSYILLRSALSLCTRLDLEVLTNGQNLQILGIIALSAAAAYLVTATLFALWRLLADLRRSRKLELEAEEVLPTTTRTTFTQQDRFRRAQSEPIEKRAGVCGYA